MDTKRHGIAAATARPGAVDLGERSREVFRHIVDSFVETGNPVGSRTISRMMEMSVSPATVRNVMADLEDAGLLMAPHSSAGRLPTEAGLRLFVDGLLEVGNLGSAEREQIESQFAGSGKSIESLLEEATLALSGLSSCAGIVMAPKAELPLKHIEFVALNPGRALVVIVTGDGIVENRLIEIPADLPSSALAEASNFLGARLVGRTIGEARSEILAELNLAKTELDALSAKVVEAGLATWARGEIGGTLIIRGQAHLLDEITAIDDLERIRALFNALETDEMMIKLLEITDGAEGVQIFIGADNELFSMAGCSAIVAPYHSSNQSLVGAIGVIGPTRMNYARIIPMVDFTAKLIGRVIGGQG